jgi:hypothetical protein
MQHMGAMANTYNIFTGMYDWEIILGKIILKLAMLAEI